MCGGDRLYETADYFWRLISKREYQTMKREHQTQGQTQLQAEFQPEAPDYPTLQSFRKNQKAIFKTMGVGAVGLAMSSCQPEPPLGGVPPMPPVENGTASGTSKTSDHLGDGPVSPEDISLGGVICPVENN